MFANSYDTGIYSRVYAQYVPLRTVAGCHDSFLDDLDCSLSFFLQLVAIRLTVPRFIITNRKKIFRSTNNKIVGGNHDFRQYRFNTHGNCGSSSYRVADR